MYVNDNPNPLGNKVGDCVIRAISIATGMEWQKVYVELAIQGFLLGDMPSSNYVWGSYLQSLGFERKVIPDTCPDCYTVREFCEDNPDGVYLLGTGTHAVTVIDGDYYDAWDSGDEVPIFYWQRKENENAVQSI